MGREMDTMMASWADRHRVTLPDLDEDGYRYFVFDGEFEVKFSQAGQEMLLETDLGELPQKRSASAILFERLLKMQMARAGGSPEILALDGERRMFVLHRSLPLSRTELPQLEDAISSFVNATAFWSTQMEVNERTSFEASPRDLQILMP
ncbi:MAG: CesT family type III secretion system chaperone [Pseudomonadota bacterium]